MSDVKNPSRFIFPRWANWLLPFIVISAVGGGLYAPTVVTLGFSPKTTAVGYAPDQPVPYSHQLHVGQLGIDCRYCHTTVEKANFAAIPPTQTCMNCHQAVRTTITDDKGQTVDNPKLAALLASWKRGTPVDWVKVHDLPDYAYFPHQAHITAGVSCVECHGRVDRMEVVTQVQPLSMSWCLDCHRAPEKVLRPKDQVTNLGWTVKDLATTHPSLHAELKAKYQTETISQEQLGTYLKEINHIQNEAYMTSCSTCHR
jgi:hypothetical protein